LFELLQQVAAEDFARPAIVTHEMTVTHGELARDAECVAAALRREGITRFAIADHGADVVVALLAGASAAGVEACQYPPDEADELEDLRERFDHEIVVSDRDDLGSLGARIVRPDEWIGTGRPSRPIEPISPRPHLVLTTGTTGKPRGVRHDWERLVRNTRRVKPGTGERWLLAYGLHQFAGLQILLHVFAAGATLVAPAPRRPREGLEAMRRLGVTHASATPTYWRFLLAELHSDGGLVPELQQITLGGEAIPGPLLEELGRIFPAANISQIYASSEFGSTGSMKDGRAGLSTDVLKRGDEADIAMRIVDGELWIRSRGSMIGYYGEPAIDADGWRATGDLVEIDGDRILFQGRTSEIINVGGVKVHPLPIEDLVSAVPGVAVARVYGRPNPMTGAIVALEVVAAPGVDQDVIGAAIREACADLPSAARPRSIRFVDDVATSGSKIVRRHTDEY
jgi:acyl-CoA synthetase (AMP-forming)/AMP-acid ligase II